MGLFDAITGVDPNKIIGAALGGAAGALSPVAPLYDRAQNFLSGTDDQRNQRGQGLTDKLTGWMEGRGVYSSPAALAARASSALARVGRNAANLHQGINLRSIARGVGKASGMAEAGHLKAGIAGLNAGRELMGQLQSADLSSGKGMMQNAAGALGSLLRGDQAASLEERMREYMAKREHDLGGSDAYRGLLGALYGWHGLSLPGAGRGWAGNDPFNNEARG